MFFGGTNFGLRTGANIDNNVFHPDITSYDYDSPISEDGTLTQKFFEIRKFIYFLLKIAIFFSIIEFLF